MEIENSDWLEFKESVQLRAGGSTPEWHYLNVRRSEISEVCDDCVKSNCSITMKNGKRHVVKMPYEKVMELV